MKAIFVPSADQDGAESKAVLLVRSTGSDPSGFIESISKFPLRLVWKAIRPFVPGKAAFAWRAKTAVVAVKLRANTADKQRGLRIFPSPVRVPTSASIVFHEKVRGGVDHHVSRVTSATRSFNGEPDVPRDMRQP
jgi:hypothetical protein